MEHFLERMNFFAINLLVILMVRVKITTSVTVTENFVLSD